MPKTREVLAGGERPWLRGGYGNIAERVSQYEAEGGLSLIEAMHRDEKVAETTRTLLRGALAEEIQLSPAITLDEEDDQFSDSDRAAAVAVHARCEAALRAAKRPNFTESVRRLGYSGLKYGTALAEPVYRVATSGPHRGKYLLDRLKVKPITAWELLVDDAYNVTAAVGTSARRGEGRAGGRATLVRDEFCLFAWQGEDDSPFGVHVAREAVDPWNMKVQLLPMLWEYLALHAVPNFVAKTGENDQDRVVVDEAGRAVDGGRMLSPVEALFEELKKVLVGGGRLICLPHGSELAAFTPPQAHEMFLAVIDLLDRAIVYGIASTTRASLEAQHSSRSDNETAQDMMALLILELKYALRSVIVDDLLTPLVRLNDGDEAADRFTPMVSLGRTDLRDFSRNAGAVSRLFVAGVLGEEDAGDALDFLGMKIRRRRRKAPNQPAAPDEGQPDPNRRPNSEKP